MGEEGSAYGGMGGALGTATSFVSASGRNEKSAFRLYSDLAASVDDNQLKLTFLGLAQEEAKHKLRFEVEYDENILAEN